MPIFSRSLLVVGCLLLGLKAQAQRRSVADIVVVPEVQVELALPANDYVLVALGVAGSTNESVPNTTSAQLRLGYEHFWNERWSVGATLRVVARENNGFIELPGLEGNVVPGLLLRHIGQLGKFRFGQRLGVEYLHAFQIFGATSSRVVSRLRLDVDRAFVLSEKLAVRPRLAYETAAYLRLQRDEDEERERVIDFGSLRAEVGLRLSPRFDLTPWLAYQTSYLNSLPQFDATGKQVSGGRTNIITPTFGLDLRLTLLAAVREADRLQLPTQH